MAPGRLYSKFWENLVSTFKPGISQVFSNIFQLFRCLNISEFSVEFIFTMHEGGFHPKNVKKLKETMKN